MLSTRNFKYKDFKCKDIDRLKVNGWKTYYTQQEGSQ